MPSQHKLSKKPAPNSAPAPQQEQATPTVPPQGSDRQDLHDRISKRAYELHARRDFQEGSALADWLDAEQDVLSQPRSAEIPLPH